MYKIVHAAQKNQMPKVQWLLLEPGRAAKVINVNIRGHGMVALGGIIGIDNPNSCPWLPLTSLTEDEMPVDPTLSTDYGRGIYVIPVRSVNVMFMNNAERARYAEQVSGFPALFHGESVWLYGRAVIAPSTWIRDKRHRRIRSMGSLHNKEIEFIQKYFGKVVP